MLPSFPTCVRAARLARPREAVDDSLSNVRVLVLRNARSFVTRKSGGPARSCHNRARPDQVRCPRGRSHASRGCSSTRGVDGASASTWVKRYESQGCPDRFGSVKPASDIGNASRPPAPSLPDNKMCEGFEDKTCTSRRPCRGALAFGSVGYRDHPTACRIAGSAAFSLSSLSPAGRRAWVYTSRWRVVHSVRVQTETETDPRVDARCSSGSSRCCK